MSLKAFAPGDAVEIRIQIRRGGAWMPATYFRPWLRSIEPRRAHQVVVPPSGLGLTVISRRIRKSQAP